MITTLGIYYLIRYQVQHNHNAKALAGSSSVHSTVHFVTGFLFLVEITRVIVGNAFLGGHRRGGNATRR